MYTLQKRKGYADNDSYLSKEDEDTSRPSAIYKAIQGRQHTLSIALPGSIIAKYVSIAGINLQPTRTDCLPPAYRHVLDLTERLTRYEVREPTSRRPHWLAR
jgi:hypothetical protein